MTSCKSYCIILMYTYILFERIHIMINKTKKLTLSKLSLIFFKISSAVMVLVFLYILFSLLNTPENEKAWLYANAYTMLEYAVMSFTLVFCGSLFIDIAEKKSK